MPEVSATEAPVTVRISQGDVVGIERDGVAVFRGIPYASAPLGELRFRAPRPPEPWSVPFMADEFGPTAPQQEYANEGGLPDVPEPIIAGDEFLNLNVWSPDLAGRAPVLVWIHGGGYTAGCSANPWYDGTSFARHGLVVVSLNYRLGAEGFLRLVDGDSNNSMRDWIAALRWVQEEIGGFGGDPGQVTVMGQSAGGMAVSALLTSPASRGLFQRAIIASGITSQAVQPAQRAASIAKRMGSLLGVEPTVEAIRGVSPQRLVQAQNELSASASLLDAADSRAESDLLPWLPEIDGDLVVGTVLEGVRAGRGSDIPVLTGTTVHEFRWAGIRAVEGPKGRRLGQRIADTFLRRPTQDFVEARRSSTAPTFRYEFQWESRADRDLIGAGHSIDIPFFFNTLDAPYFAPYAGENPPAELAAAMHGAFARFAATGDPGWPAEREPGHPVEIFDVPTRLQGGVEFEE
ncbi:carboxylesterase family protein [soil metagenome]